MLNLRSGKPAARLSDQLASSMSRAWAAFPMGTSHVLAFPKGFAIANLDSGRVIETQGFRGTLMAHFGDIISRRLPFPSRVHVFSQDGKSLYLHDSHRRSLYLLEDWQKNAGALEDEGEGTGK